MLPEKEILIALPPASRATDVVVRTLRSSKIPGVYRT
jgi:hypothetical protein